MLFDIIPCILHKVSFGIACIYGVLPASDLVEELLPGVSVVSALYSGKPPCLNFHQATLSAVNDATASPPFSALLMKIYSAEFHQI